MSGNDIEEVSGNEDLQENKNTWDGISNIFDDFSTDSSLIEDVKKSKERMKKDWYYYLSILWKLFQWVFIVLLISSIIIFAYIKIQESENFKNNSFLDPFCFIIKRTEVASPYTYCSSITATKKYYEEELSTLKAKQTKWMLSNLVVIYENENFLNSKDVTFLKNESQTRLDTIKVLEEFDSLKKAFLWLEKNKIQCARWSIDANNKVFEITCNAYSQSYENNWIVWFSWDPTKKEEYVSGTSASIANSFLNYLEKNATWFSVFDRQKMFESDTILDSSELWITSWFTKRTNFTIKLKINF